MAPSGCSKRLGRRVRAEGRRSDASSHNGLPSRRRVHNDVIDGVEIFSFENALELEYFANIEEPLPRKIRKFRGFRDEDNAVDIIKYRFDQYIKQFSTGNVPREESPERVVPLVPDEDAMIVLSDDESKPAEDVDVVDKAVVIEDKPPQSANKTEPAVITIDSDSDDDVIMVSDPNAPLPQPVRDCVCPNCGKVKRVDQNRRVASDSDKHSRVADVSVTTGEVAIITDDEGTVENTPVEANSTPLPSKDLPPQATQAADIHEEVPPPPAEVVTEEVPAQAPTTTPVSRSPLNVFSLENQPSSPFRPQPTSTKPINDISPNCQKPSQPQQPTTSQTTRQGCNEVFSLAAHPNSPSRPHHISTKPTINMSPKGQKPSHLKPPATVPQTVRLVSKESGKTFILKVDGAKSKILQRPTTLIPPACIPRLANKLCSSNKHPQSFHYLEPGQNPCGASSSEAESPHAVLEQLPKPVIAPRTADVGKNLHQKKPSLTYRVTIPPNTMRVTLTSGFSDKNKVTRAKPVDGAKGHVQVKNPGFAKPGVSIGSSPQKSEVVVPHQSQMKQPPFKTAIDLDSAQQKAVVVVTHQSQMKQPPVKTAAKPRVATGDICFNGLTPCSNDQDSQESAVLESPSSARSPTEAGCEPLVVEDDTESVVRDLVDFVIRQEHFPTSYPYDQERTELLCLEVPCRMFRCRMGCVCVSLTKKNVRRVRCRNAACIFGCVCLSHGAVLPANRHAKTIPNVKTLGTSRRKQVLTVLTDSDTDSRMNPVYDVQPPMESFLPVNKVARPTISSIYGSVPDCGMPGSRYQPAWIGLRATKVPGGTCNLGNSGSQESTTRGSGSVPGSGSVSQGSGCGSSTTARPASKGSLARSYHVVKTSLLTSQKSHPSSDMVALPDQLPNVKKPIASGQAPCRGPVTVTVPGTQPRRFFGWEKVPIPERALVCLTPGLGYVPLDEVTPKVRLRDPFNPGASKSFLSIQQAIEWLNCNLVHTLKTSADLRWVVADRNTLEKKQLNRLSIDLLRSPNCTISRNGAVFSSQ